MMETEEKYKVVIVDDERTAIDALRRELEPYKAHKVNQTNNAVASGFIVSRCGASGYIGA